METKPISPKLHGLADYLLVGGLLVLPSVMGLNKKAKTLFTIEGLTLLPYVALSEHPMAIKPLIPFATHGKIDTMNVAQFALQTLWKPIRKDKKALWFNIGFTALAGAVVLLTDWRGRNKAV